jgi:hypothetical protein
MAVEVVVAFDLNRAVFEELAELTLGTGAAPQPRQSVV